MAKAKGSSVVAVTPLEKARAARKAKQKSAERAAAEQLVKQAANGSDQEQARARMVLKGVKFTEIAKRRMSRAIKVLRQVEALSNRGQYRWEPDQAAKMLKALDVAVGNIRARFTSTQSKEAKDEFTF